MASTRSICAITLFLQFLTLSFNPDLCLGALGSSSSTLSGSVRRRHTHPHRLTPRESGTSNYTQPTSLPPFLTNNPLSNGKPWGTANTTNKSPYTQAPVTGIVRHYDWTISTATVSPDGVNKPAILVNGQFPGPMLEANWGDTFEIVVNNDLSEGTAIHWHGILQTGSPWMDGSPSMTQCPIPPGSTFTYRFQADLYGTSWYHAHYSSQYAAGLLGPMIIYGPMDEPYDVDLGPVLLSDWYHADYLDVVAEVLAPADNPPEPPSDNTGINGKFSCLLGSGRCTLNRDLAKFQFQDGKTHRLRLINSGALDTLSFSIDGHQLKVIANDFNPVVPYDTDRVILGIGQRTDILVIANATSGAYWMRNTVSCGASNQPNALGVFYYDTYANASNTSLIPSFSPQPVNPQCNNDPLSLTEPMYKMSLPDPDTTITLNASVVQNSTRQWNWQLNNINFRGDYNDPVLLLSATGNNTYPWDPNWNVYNLQSSKTYRFITYNQSPAPHPLHLHGHNIYVLAQGQGVWDGQITRPDNPQRRDVQQLAPGEYLVAQSVNENPGVWPWHCHIAWHLSAGMDLNMIEQPDAIRSLRVPSIMYQQCRDWAAYTNTTVVDQIDSGF